MSFEKDMVEKMLEDPKILEELGLPEDMPDEMKQQVAEMILRDINDFENSMLQFSDVDEPFDESRTPAEQFVEQALVDLGIEYEIDEEVNPRNLEIGVTYKMHFPNGKHAIVILERIMENSFGDDYIFKNIKGAEKIAGKSEVLASDEFPLPISLVMQTKFTLV